ncbi:roadblock/LC7 domain-containing protein [Streptomyces microflavus]|uniref:roadblock/LC7 domain-containing protein n=1 Tax=Streptomyces microflavus TaxID=1919 RepID=UPI00332F7BBC
MNPRPDMNWLLDNLVDYPHARHAVVLSSDGLGQHHSKDVTDEQWERISATAAGIASLAKSAAPFASDTPTPYQMTMITYGNGYIFIITAGEGSTLVASGGFDIDINAFSDRMTHVVGRMRNELAVGARQAGQG